MCRPGCAIGVPAAVLLDDWLVLLLVESEVGVKELCVDGADEVLVEEDGEDEVRAEDVDTGESAVIEPTTFPSGSLK